MATPSVSGLAVSAIVGGSILFWSGIRNQSIADTARAVIKGRPVPLGVTLGKTAAQGAVAGADNLNTAKGTQIGAQVAAAALKYLGVPYRWAHEDPAGWDCSGFVTWVLHHDFGIALPNNNHTTSAQFLIWSGARDIPRSACSPGDLVCWASHIGIATSRTDMVNAPTAGALTRVDRIWSVPAPVIRRPVAYGTT